MGYLSFKIIEQKPKTLVYQVINKQYNLVLGYIKWYGAWRQYCFFPLSDTLYHVGCLEELINFIEKINNDHKKGGIK